jgi:nicotinamide mononucleotide adenylyltransferase
MAAIVRDYGLVVITRHGSDPEKFIYESDLLTNYKVS